MIRDRWPEGKRGPPRHRENEPPRRPAPSNTRVTVHLDPTPSVFIDQCVQGHAQESISAQAGTSRLHQRLIPEGVLAVPPVLVAGDPQLVGVIDCLEDLVIHEGEVGEEDREEEILPEGESQESEDSCKDE